MITFSDLSRFVDGFCEKYKYGAKEKADLLDLVQRAVDHGEGKEQSKITGIIVKTLKALMGGGGKE